MSQLLIRHLEQFGPLSESEKRALAALVMRVREVGADQDIVSEGDRPKDCKVILEGFVCRYKLLPQGRRQIMSIQIPGDVVDLQGFLLGELDHSLGTLTPVKIGVIPYDLLLEATERFPRIGRALWQSTLLDSAVFREWMVGIGRRSATQRIAHLICEMCFRLRSAGLADNGSYELPLTQAEIADALGLSTVHVNRSLQTLRRKKLLSFERGRVAILDWEGLKRAGEFESRYLRVGRGPDRGEGKRASQGGSAEAH